MRNTKFFILLVFIISFQSLTAQYEHLQINLEISSSYNEYNHIRFSLYQKDSISTLLGIKHNPRLDSNNIDTWFKRDADTIIEISSDDFNRIAKMSINLSSITILKGTRPSNPIIGNDGYQTKLELSVTMDKIEYNIWTPTNNTKERSLGSFLAICEEIIKLAELKPRILMK